MSGLTRQSEVGEDLPRPRQNPTRQNPSRVAAFRSRLPSSTQSDFSRNSRRLRLRSAAFAGSTLITRNADDGEERPAAVSQFSPSGLQQHRDTDTKVLQNATMAASPNAVVLGDITNCPMGGLRLSKPATDSHPLGSPTHDEINDFLVRSENKNREENLGPQDHTTESPTNRIMSRGSQLLERGVTPRHSPPYRPRAKSRHSRRASGSSPDSESSEYIEHLEAQLAALQNQLRSLTSPNSTRLHSAKLRSLTAESRLLRQEVTEWERKFNERVRDEMEVRSEIETSLKARIRNLEREVEFKDGKMTELEHAFNRVNEDLESVQDQNVALVNRMDALTDLFAESPTREDKGRGKRRRLTLLIPKTPILSRLSSPVRMTQGSHETSELETGALGLHPINAGENGQAIASAEEKKCNQWHDPSSSNLDSPAPFPQMTTSFDLLGRSPSRRISTVSDTAIGLGTPIRNPSPVRDRAFQKHRRMRRFMTGSGGPKQLILPITSRTGPFSTTASTIAHAHLDEEPTPKAVRAQSAILSSSCGRLGSNVVDTDLDDRCAARFFRRSSTTWVELEAAFSPSDGPDGDKLMATHLQSDEPGGDPDMDGTTDLQANANGRPSLRRCQSLFAELERAEGQELATVDMGGTSPRPTSDAGASPQTREREPLKPNRYTTRFYRFIHVQLGINPDGNTFKVLDRILKLWCLPITLTRKVVTQGGLIVIPWAKNVVELAFILLRLVIRPFRRESVWPRRGSTPDEVIQLLQLDRSTQSSRGNEGDDLKQLPLSASDEPEQIIECVNPVAQAYQRLTRESNRAEASSDERCSIGGTSNEQQQRRRQYPSHPFHCVRCAGTLSAQHFRCWLDHSAYLGLAIASHLRARQSQTWILH